MEFQDVVRRRKMVRDYAGDPVDPAIVDRALHNAVRAPNAGFSQGWGFLVLDTPDGVQKYWEVTCDPDDLAEPDAWLTGMMHAPVIVIPCSSKAAYLKRYAQPDKGWTDEDETRWPVPFWHIDTGMAALLILQTVTDAGLGACYFGVPPDVVAPVREAFGIPDTFDPIGAITIGHRIATDGLPGSPSDPAPQAAGRRRPPRSLDQLNLLTARPQSIGAGPGGQRAAPGMGLGSEIDAASDAAGGSLRASRPSLRSAHGPSQPVARGRDP